MLPPFQWRTRLQWVLAWFRVTLAGKFRPIDQIRERWGKEGRGDGWLSTKLFDLTGSPEGNAVDDGTWQDLEFERLFKSVDSTLTPLGSQYLYRKLRTFRENPSELEASYLAYQALRADSALREELQLGLWSLRRESNALICESLFGGPPCGPRWTPLVFTMSTLSLLAIAATVANPALLWLLGVTVLLNMGVVVFVRHDIHETFLSTERIARMIAAAARIAKTHAPGPVSQPARLNEILRETADLRGSFRWFLADRGNDLVASFFFWLNLLFLADHVAAVLVTKKLQRHRAMLTRVFLQVGALDADIAIASWLERIPVHCMPSLTSAKKIELTGGFHPLLSAPVANSLELNERSALVVGTNMAGKTTFIKMIGANIILGRTLGVCFATSAVIPRSRVVASIRAEHSMESGKSHFFSELERILSFVRMAQENRGGVFLIDELFRGTNTPERIAAGKAVLECLGADALVLVTTHDVELQNLLGSRYLAFHFVENPDLPEVFDYRLHRGISTSRNAITLLQKLGFPQPIVTEARRLADALTAR